MGGAAERVMTDAARAPVQTGPSGAAMERETAAEREGAKGSSAAGERSMLPRDPGGIPVERPGRSGGSSAILAGPRAMAALEGGRGLPLLRKLTVGESSDPAEAEADAMAAEAMKVPGSTGGERPRARRAALRGALAGWDAEAPPAVGAVLRSPGQALEGQTRQFMEERFGMGFGHVRVHAGEQAADSARQVGARAYAVGRDVVFGAGEYRPETAEGRRLIAHELAHVAQAGAPVVRRETDDKAAQGTGGGQAGGQAGGDQSGRIQRAAVNDVSDNPDREIREISKFDVTPGNKRPWDLNKLTAAIVKLLKADERAYIRVLGAYPVIAGEEDQEPAANRAETVKRALIQWIGPGKFGEERFYTGFATGQIGDPQVIVEVGYNGKVVSEGTASGPSAPQAPPQTGPVDSTPAADGGKAASGDKSDDDGGDLQSAVGGQWAWHLNRQAKPDKTVQVQLTKGSGAAQSVYQFQINVETGDVQALAGGQLQKESKTVSVLKDAIKVKASVFIQVLGGISKANGAASGSITFQVQAGAQVTAIFGPVTVAIQAAPSVTYQAGQPIAVDFGLAAQGGATSLPDSRKFPPFIGIPIVVGTF